MEHSSNRVDQIMVSPNCNDNKSIPSINGWPQGPLQCARCGAAILDRMVVRVMETYFHSCCLKCNACGDKIADLCFSDGVEVFCQKDFNRLFGAECIGCTREIGPSESVRRTNDKLYHENCFRCLACNRLLETGSKYYIRDDHKLICEHDYEKLKAETEKKKEEYRIDHELLKSLTSEQNQILEESYKLNQRPSREIRKNLCNKAQLSLRDVSVWFQSRRAMERRMRKTNKGNDSGMCELSFTFPTDAYSGSVQSSSTTDNISDISAEFVRPEDQYFQRWIKELDSLAADVVPPNIDLKVTDFRPGGEVCLNTIVNNSCSFADGPYWFQRMNGFHCNQNWASCL